MTDTLKLAPDLYTAPPVNAVPGSRMVYRSIELLTTDLITTQLIALSVLPAGHRLMGAVLESDDLDTGGPTVTVSVGILNTYYNQAAATTSVPAAYNSGGATNTGTAPALVSGQNIFTASTVSQAGGRVYPSLACTTAIGVDEEKDRIVAVQFPAAPTTPAAGTLSLILFIDEA